MKKYTDKKWESRRWMMFSIAIGAIIMIEAWVNFVPWLFWVGATFVVIIPAIITILDDNSKNKNSEDLVNDLDSHSKEEK